MNNSIKINATLETRTKKDGSGTYQVVVIKIADNIEKLVFLNNAELELLKALKEDTDSKSSSKLPFDK